MSTEPDPTLPPPGNPARTLAAWIPVPDDQRPPDGPGSPDWARSAAALLAERPANPDQSGLLEPLPPQLSGHAETLRRSDGAQRMFADGWDLALVTDLRRVVAAQRTVELSSSHEREPVEQDLLSVAHLALPVRQPAAEISARFDPENQSWRITSRNPNVRITGRFGAEVRPNALGFGFIVEVLTSFMSVAEYRGRYLLRDGYHRAQRLLGAGIVSAPVFVRRFADGEAIFGREMLPEQVWTGQRPPLLADYGDDRLAHDIWLPLAETTIYINALPVNLAISHR